MKHWFAGLVFACLIVPAEAGWQSRDSNYNTVFVSGGGALDPSTTAWVNAVVTAGGAVSNTQKTNVDTLIKALKSASLWSSNGVLDRMWLFAGESDTHQATIDIIALETLTVVVAAASLGANGYTGNGGSGGGASNLQDSATNIASLGNLTQNSASMGIHNATSRTSQIAGGELRTSANTSNLGCLQFAFGGLNYSMNGGGNNGVANANVQGVYVLVRTGASATAVYKQGSATAIDTGTSASSSIAGGNFLGFLQDASGTATTDTISMGFVGAGMTSAQAVNFMNAWNNYAIAWGISGHY
jgi:hypothetical protein